MAGRQINTQRLEQGDFTNLVQELRGDEEQFYLYFRMSPCIFDELLNLVGVISIGIYQSFFQTRHFLQTSLILANQTKATMATKVKSSTCLISKATSLATEATSLATAQSGRFGRATTATA